MSGVSDETLDAAVEAMQVFRVKDRGAMPWNEISEEFKAQMRRDLDAAVPVIVEAERERVRKLLERELFSDEMGRLAGSVGEAIADVSGSYGMEFTMPEELAQGLVRALAGEDS